MHQLSRIHQPRSDLNPHVAKLTSPPQTHTRTHTHSLKTRLFGPAAPVSPLSKSRFRFLVDGKGPGRKFIRLNVNMF